MPRKDNFDDESRLFISTLVILSGARRVVPNDSHLLFYTCGVDFRALTSLCLSEIVMIRGTMKLVFSGKTDSVLTRLTTSSRC